MILAQLSAEVVVDQMLMRYRRIWLQLEPTSEGGLRLAGIARFDVGTGGDVACQREVRIAFREAHQLPCRERSAFLPGPCPGQGGGDGRGARRDRHALGEALLGL